MSSILNWWFELSFERKVFLGFLLVIWFLFMLAIWLPNSEREYCYSVRDWKLSDVPAYCLNWLA